MKNVKIITLTLILFLIVGCRNSKLVKMEEKNTEYIEQITVLTEKLTDISKERDELLEKLGKYEPEVFETGECLFTKTYRIVDVTKYKGEDDTLKYIILDQFQVKDPFIVKLTKDQVSSLTKDQNYEFTFSGDKRYQKSENREIFQNYELIDIKETDKVGLDQLQEACH